MHNGSSDKMPCAAVFFGKLTHPTEHLGKSANPSGLGHLRTLIVFKNRCCSIHWSSWCSCQVCFCCIGLCSDPGGGKICWWSQPAMCFMVGGTGVSCCSLPSLRCAVSAADCSLKSTGATENGKRPSVPPTSLSTLLFSECSSIIIFLSRISTCCFPR